MKAETAATCIALTGTWTRYACGKKGRPEPAMRDKYDSNTDAIIKVPNKGGWSGEGDSYEGKIYCGTHSPSRKAAREAPKRMEEARRWNANRERTIERRSALQAAVDRFRELAQTEDDIAKVELLAQLVK